MVISVPELRVRPLRDVEPATSGEFVLYWMIAYRRPFHNFALQQAVDWAQRLDKPLVVLEALRCDYRWASDRLHQFIIEGMVANTDHFADTPAFYYPYLESKVGDGKGLLAALAARAAVVVSDDFPSFFLPRMVEAATRQVPVRFELVDSNGLLPLRAADRVFSRAFDFRRFLQKHLLPHLAEMPSRDPLAGTAIRRLTELPQAITERWPPADPTGVHEAGMGTFPIDHEVRAVDARGGVPAAEETLRQFLSQRLSRYEDERNQPQREATSRLSPYLHFGYISAHEIFEAVTRQADWTPDQVATKATGSARGWWGTATEVESFLDELITWREVGYNMCWQRDDYDQYESLPNWAQKTLAEHAADDRPHVYSLQQFEFAETHDSLWNAAQNQLRREGRIHNYLRMLWGKKILEWSASPKLALDIMIELNNKYALDGRNPNSYSGIFWVLGRYDRAWGPERPIFGKIRYMSSENTARKVKVKEYIRQYTD